VPDAGPRIADVGTGRSNIAVSLAHERQDAHVGGFRIDPTEALRSE